MEKYSYALANPVDRIVHICENILTSHLLREALADVLFEKYKVRTWLIKSPVVDHSPGPINLILTRTRCGQLRCRELLNIAC